MPEKNKHALWKEHLEENAERGRNAARTFAYTLVETTGERALSAWSDLNERADGATLVLGGDVDLWSIANHINGRRERGETPDAVLAAADRIRFPEDLFTLRDAQHKETDAYWRREREAGRPLPFSWDEEEEWPPTGPWPEEAFQEPPLAVASCWDFGADLNERARWVPLERVYIARIPGADPTEAPAHLHWGSWNDVPSSEVLVAALRSWRDRYGAKLVGISRDTWSLLVDRPPTTRGEALVLAREMVALCSDLLGEVETLQGQAALTMNNRWWNLWWD